MHRRTESGRDVADLQNPGAVEPDDLERVIKEWFDKFVDAYGKPEIKPKAHYALHLAQQLRIFGILLSCFTHERKHRIVKKYTRDRNILKAWSLSAIEEITVHQVYETRMPFFNEMTVSQPRGNTFLFLRELFPGVEDKRFSLHADIHVNGATVNRGDVVSFWYMGETRTGEFLLCVGITSDDPGVPGQLKSFVSMWQPSPRAHDDMTCCTFLVRDNPVMVDASELDTCFTHRMSDDKTSSVVLIPYDCRGQFGP